MNITVQIVYQYGNRRVFPVCETARKLAALAGHATFTNGDIGLLKELGYTIEVVKETL
jgi:hypothetical protein